MKAKAKHRKRLGRYWKAAVALLVLIAVLNGIAFIPGLSDWYVAHLYNPLTAPLSHLSALAPVAIGELLMYLGIALVLLGILLLIVLAFLRKRTRYRRFVAHYFKTVLALVLVVGLLFSLNLSIPFQATPLIESMQQSDQQYTLKQMQQLRNQIVEGLNAAAEKAPRNSDGNLVYSEDIDQKVAEALNNLGKDYPRLKSFYPTPKSALCSDVLEWMGIGGYTYPYTMEVTYNHYVTNLYYPFLSAHESAHHKGYYLESEADFLAFLACSQSDDALLQYSAYESVYYYVEEAYAKALLSAYDSADATACYNAQPQLSSQVCSDITQVNNEREENYENSVNKDAEKAFSGAAEKASEYGWSAQSQVLQKNTYSGVVELLLAYTFN